MARAWFGTVRLPTGWPPSNATALSDDSQGDSQVRESLRTTAHVGGLLTPDVDLGRTSVDASGCQKRGLQNCLRGAAEASWVGSIPIHPRQFEQSDSQEASDSFKPEMVANRHRAGDGGLPCPSSIDDGICAHLTAVSTRRIIFPVR